MKVARVDGRTLGVLTSISGLGGTNPIPNLDDLPDVDMTGVTDGQVPVWDDATDTWLPGTVSGSGLPWFDVTDYGAVGDGVTDDTAEIQATIDAAAAAGGGTIFFPVGEYIIAGALQDTGARNAQLLLPTVTTAVPLPVFRFLGANRVTQHNIGTRPDPAGFSVLRSTLTGGSGTAAVVSGGNEVWTDRNSISVAIQDLICIAPNNPSLTWWNLYSTQGASVQDVVIHVLSMPDVSTQPTNSNAYGIRLPHRGNSNYTRVDGLLVGGHYTGVEVSELVIARGISVGQCIVGMELTSAPHAFLIINYQQAGCTYGTRVTPGSFDVTGRILYAGAEHLATPTFPSWAVTVYDFDDPSDAFVGDVTWLSADYTGPVDHIYNINGGANGIFTEIGTATGLTVSDEGSPLATNATELDFVGAGVVASGTGAAKTITIPGFGGALDDLSDVAITSAVSGDRLRYSGSAWLNSALRWEPHVAYDGTVVLDGNGDPVMVEVS